MRQAFERESELYRRDAAGAFFAGYVFGMLSALAVVLACGGCWTAAAEALEPEPRHAPASLRSWSCSRLTSVAGELPPEGDITECIKGDPDRYWMCSDSVHHNEALMLRQWIGTAIAVCAE